MEHTYDVAAFGRMMLHVQTGHKIYSGTSDRDAREAMSRFSARLRRWHKGTYYLYLLKDGVPIGSITGIGRGWS